VVEKFYDDYEQTIDGKGRVSVPSPIRSVVQARDPKWTEGLRPSFMVVHGTASWTKLECYPIDEYQKITRGIERMKRGSPERQRAEMLYFGRAFPAQILEDGRVLLPLQHRERLGLTDKVRFIGLGDMFHIMKGQAASDAAAHDFDAWLDAQDDGAVLAMIPDIDDED